MLYGFYKASERLNLFYSFYVFERMFCSYLGVIGLFSLEIGQKHNLKMINPAVQF